MPELVEATQWWELGDYPGVRRSECFGHTYYVLDLKYDSAIIYPGDYIVELPNKVVKVVPKDVFEKEYERVVKPSFDTKMKFDTDRLYVGSTGVVPYCVGSTAATIPIVSTAIRLDHRKFKKPVHANCSECDKLRRK